MTKQKVQKGVRLPSDTAKRVERYAEDHGISESDAIRRLLLYGLEREENGYRETLQRIDEQVSQPLWKRLFH